MDKDFSPVVFAPPGIDGLSARPALAAHRFRLAHTAFTVPRSGIHVLCGVRVALRAVRLCSCQGGWAFPSQDVDSLGHGLHMLWVDALSCSAQVVNDQSDWDRPSEKLVRESMCEYFFAAPAAGGEPPVAVHADLASPRPTRVGDRANSLPELLLRCVNWVRHLDLQCRGVTGQAALTALPLHSISGQGL